MADLVSGKYGQFNPLQVAFGLNNAVNPEVPARSNAEYLGFSTLTDGALAGSGILCAVPIPIDPGTVVTNVSMLVGNTAASTPTHQFAAIYSGISTPALIAQSTDGTTAAIAAGAMYNFALSSAQTITGAQAPNGYIWAGVCVTGTAVNTAIGVTQAANTQYQYFTSSTSPKGNSPVALAVTAGSALGATAAATIASPSAKAAIPFLILS